MNGADQEIERAEEVRNSETEEATFAETAKKTLSEENLIEEERRAKRENATTF